MSLASRGKGIKKKGTLNRRRGEFAVLAEDRTINDLQDSNYNDIEDGKVDRPSQGFCQDSKEFVDVHDRTQPKPVKSKTLQAMNTRSIASRKKN